MKKVLSIILCAIMVFGCLPFAVFADDNVNPVVDFTQSRSFTGTNELLSHTDYYVKPGVTMTVPEGMTVFIPSSSKLVVEPDGRLVVNGNLIVMEDAKLYVEGYIVGGQKVEVRLGIDGNPAGIAQLTIHYESFSDAGIEGKIKEVRYTFSESAKADVAGTLPDLSAFHTLDPQGGSFTIPIGNFIYIKTVFEGEDPARPKFDPELFSIYFADAEIPYVTGYRSVKVIKTGEITFAQWTKDSDYYRLCKIQLPKGDGYEVIGRDEESDADGVVYVKYGEPFAFRVEIDEAFNMSRPEVYVYNGYGFIDVNPNPIDPVTGLPTNLGTLSPIQSVDGYYIINPIIGDTTVSVQGVIKNDTINSISTILDAVKNVLKMFMSFFERIRAIIFGG